MDWGTTIVVANVLIVAEIIVPISDLCTLTVSEFTDVENFKMLLGANVNSSVVEGLTFASFCCILASVTDKFKEFAVAKKFDYYKY